MSNLSLFMKQNKIKRPNTFYTATQSLLDESGQPLKWEIRPITTTENDNLREACMIEVPVKGKPNLFRPKLNTNIYMAKMAAASIIEPNLYSAELQDSYGVTTPEDLLKEMIDSPGEYNDFVGFIQEYSGFQISFEDKVEEAKN